MDSICLKELTFVAKTVQQERNQFELMTFRQLRVNILKLLRVCYAIIGWQLHPGQQYRSFVSQAGFDDGFKVVTDGFDGCTAQSVIAAELDNDDIRPMDFKRLLDAIASARCGFATDAVVNHVSRGLRLQLFFQQTDPSGFLGQAVACRQTITEYHNSRGCGFDCRQGRACGA